MRIMAIVLVSVFWSEPLLAETIAPVPTLADAIAIIGTKRKVDLTHAFGPATPVWAGFGPAKFTPAVDPRGLEAYTIARDGFRATYYQMVGAYGTHVEPPATIAPTGTTSDDIPLDAMMMPLVVLDDTPYLAADPDHAFSPADLQAFEEAHGPVPKGSFVALRTDMSKDWSSDPERFRRARFPGWSLAVLKTLFEGRGVIAIGQESLATDDTASMEGATYVATSGHYQIQGLSDLDQVPLTGAAIVATWPKVKAGFAFPARVFAILP